MGTPMTTSGMTSGQVNRACEIFRAQLEKHASELRSEAVQLVFGQPELGPEWLAVLRKRVEAISSSILRLISGGETLVLDETDGTETIPASKGIFACIDSDFKNWGADEASGPTPKTPVAVHELARDATFAQMFGANPGALCLTQSQILGFIRKHRNWLRTDGYATFFLFRSRGELFVADVYFSDRGRLKAGVGRFEFDGVGSAERRHRIVLPQL